VRIGSKVTLRSLLPDTISTVRVSGFHPELGMATTTVCVPTPRLIFMGVTLAVSVPSTETFAPEGNDVTFRDPFCAYVYAVSKQVITITMARRVG
jgi:hypothetical protein